MKTELLKIRDELKKTERWNEILLAINSAYVSMGTFEEPLEEGLKDLTYGGWQLEQAKRIALAALDVLIKK